MIDIKILEFISGKFFDERERDWEFLKFIGFVKFDV